MRHSGAAPARSMNRIGSVVVITQADTESTSEGHEEHTDNTTYTEGSEDNASSTHSIDQLIHPLHTSTYRNRTNIQCILCHINTYQSE